MSITLTLIGGFALIVGLFLLSRVIVVAVQTGAGLVALIVVSPYIIGLLVLAVLGIGLGQIVKILAERLRG